MLFLVVWTSMFLWWRRRPLTHLRLRLSPTESGDTVDLSQLRIRISKGRSMTAAEYARRFRPGAALTTPIEEWSIWRTESNRFEHPDWPGSITFYGSPPKWLTQQLRDSGGEPSGTTGEA